MELPRATAAILLLLVLPSMSVASTVATLDHPAEASTGPSQNKSTMNPPQPHAREDRQDAAHRRTYIVLLEAPEDSSMSRIDHRRWHELFVPANTELDCSYTAVFNGFAATLTEAELAAVAEMPGFIRAFPDVELRTMTTRTPSFMGLNRGGPGLWSDTEYGQGVIVGVLDTGIYGMHPSFGDDGVPAPPARWGGHCTGRDQTRCNNKLVGSKSFIKGEDPVDEQGHGTHVAATAAGNFVDGASVNGLAPGTAAGIAPHAHIAMYKVCGGNGNCYGSAVTCAMDEAIRDGVDVINLSLGFGGNGPGDRIDIDNDPIAIGAFSAVSKGITVVCAAGNSGPGPSTAINDYPWVITVGAGSVDRHLDAEVAIMQENVSFAGESLFPGPDVTDPLAVVDRGDCRQSRDDDASLLAGKVAICQQHEGLSTVQQLNLAGVAGVILIDQEQEGLTTVLSDYGSNVVVTLTSDIGAQLLQYVHAGDITAKLFFNGAVYGDPAPRVAYFSSRGPSVAFPGILKPDVLAPGLNIIAAAPPAPGSGTLESTRFQVKSGTSMATPHVTGVAALLKSAHPDWTPAAIRSAILTTANTDNNMDTPIEDEQQDYADAYAIGAGQVNATRATDPGLVFDADIGAYATLLCQRYGQDILRSIARNTTWTCAEKSQYDYLSLNYPTIMVPLVQGPVTVSRMVTHVGQEAETYKAVVYEPADSIQLTVVPETLTFSGPGGEKMAFLVTVNGNGYPASQGSVIEAAVTWVSDNHTVRIPVIAVFGLQ